MDIQRLRNLTTGRLHTTREHIYQDVEYIIGEPGVMTHMLPEAVKAMMPYLKRVASEERLYDKQYDISHVGDIPIPQMNETERKAYFELFNAL